MMRNKENLQFLSHDSETEEEFDNMGEETRRTNYRFETNGYQEEEEPNRYLAKSKAALMSPQHTVEGNTIATQVSLRDNMSFIIKSKIFIEINRHA